MSVNEKGRLSIVDNRPLQSGQEDLNLRPHGPEPEGSASHSAENTGFAADSANGRTPGRTSEGETSNADGVPDLAAALLALSSDDRARLAALLVAGLGDNTTKGE
jgi:hypothetical protein